MKKFTKMEGLGNSFVVFRGPYAPTAKEVASYCALCDVDGLLVVSPVNDALVEMKYWNNDGSVAEMCGNGLRCVTRFAVDNRLVLPGKFNVKTDAGVLAVIWDGKDPSLIEVQVGKVKTEKASISRQSMDFSIANVGNPHAITFVEDTKKAPVKTVGPEIENDTYFPNKTNVEFVQIISPNHISIRIWERGVGETKACGTGMVAAAAVSAKKGLIQYPVEVKVPGGHARIWVDEEGYSRMLGQAEFIE